MSDFDRDDWIEADEDELKLLALKLIELGLKELGITLGEFVEFVQDMESDAECVEDPGTAE